MQTTKRGLTPLHLALILILSCILFRLLSSSFPEIIPNISPLMALALLSAIYLPRRWGWLVGPAAMVVTDLAFLELNYRTDGSGTMFSWWTVISLGIYVLAAGLGLLISRRKSLGKIVAGSLACSLLFYVAANTFSWWHDVVVKMNPGYSPTLAGWWQANTLGLPGYPPTWIFLRNGMAGDLLFVFVLLLVFDRALLLGRSRVKVAPDAI
ncbi:MAG: hypothetical protein LV480_01350 [Methylacidiphilales bacterium]|nr:hypothetical protein [Candidatus Methylacidiphilales bacterium]